MSRFSQLNYNKDTSKPPIIFDRQTRRHIKKNNLQNIIL